MIPDLKGVRIKTRHISKNVYMLEATGDVAGNIGVSVGPDGIIPHDAKIIPGHYDITDIDGLKMTYDMLLETIGVVQKKIAQGKNIVQIKAEGFPAKYNAWGGGYTSASDWIENIFNGLSSFRSANRVKNKRWVTDSSSR